MTVYTKLFTPSGPEALPWKKFRILPLSKERQRILVANSFLEDNKRHLVNQHLAAELSTLGNSPLFLTLLCRFVKDLGVQPANDHQLLTSHLERLSAREPEYIARRYGLTPQQIMQGAQRLAVLFASTPSLSLAPKVDEIYAALGDEEFPVGTLQNMISALIDVKIGRNDVAVSRHGDRRFAFSHRRYQETLFANFLALNSQFIVPRDLLLKPEWRDYAVTLLQTQTSQDIAEMLAVATDLLVESSETQCRVAVKYLASRDVGFFTWDNERFVGVLSILQEGLARRLSDIPDTLSEAVLKILQPRWESGDHLDRYMVIKLGGLLPQPVLIDYLKVALVDGMQQVAAMAFKQCIFLRETSKEINKLICQKLARETLAADKITTRLQLEALAGRLPSSVGAGFVFKRCVWLRKILAKLSFIGIFPMLPNFVFFQILRIIPLSKKLQASWKRIRPNLVYRGGNEWMMATLMFPILLGIHETIDRLKLKIDNHDGFGKAINQFIASSYFAPIVLVYIVGVIMLFGSYRMRDEDVS